MNSKNANRKCPNCGGLLEVNHIKGCYCCNHCGSEFELEESDSIRKERVRESIRADAAYKSEKHRNETNINIEKIRSDAEIKKSGNSLIKTFLVVLTILVLIGVFVIHKVVHRVDDLIHADDIKISQTLIDFEGMTYEEMKGYFEDSGFTSVEGVPLGDLTNKLSEKDGIIKEITINGTREYKVGDFFSTDASVKITYHSVSDHELEGIQAFQNADFYINKDYSIAEADMKDAGFTDIELIPLKDVNANDSEIGNINEISINGNSSFEFTSLFSKDANVKIKYHSQKLKKITVGAAAEEYIKKDYRSVISELKNAGFYNFDYTLLEDASLLVKKNTVEGISINGDSSFYAGKTFDEDAGVSISIHIDKKDRNAIEAELYPDSGRVILPLSAKEMIGKDYKQVVQQLEDAGFTNINPYPNPVIKEGFNPLKKKDGEIQSVTINGSTDINKNKSYDKDVLIRIIYYTLAEEKDAAPKNTQLEMSENEVQISFSAKDLKGENYLEVLKLLSDDGFSNVSTEKIEDIDNNAKIKFLQHKDGEVKEVIIDNNEKYAKGEVFSKDAEIVVYYHTYK